MKKEFNAPIVEVKEFNVTNSIMDEPIFISGTQNKVGFPLEDAAVSEGFKQWKGLGE